MAELFRLVNYHNLPRFIDEQCDRNQVWLMIVSTETGFQPLKYEDISEYTDLIYDG